MSNLVGTGLNQVPTNGMLGGLAYQDPNHASIKNLDLKNLSQINSEIADTAVDVFVYDTRKDSDGGAWRKRTQNTSWYNETLGTATRGSRKDFPAVAVIVAESNPNKVTIYDGDDPDLPMWMVFSTSTGSGSTDANFLAVAGQTLSSVAMLNGDLCIGFPSGNGWGISRVNFVSDSQFWYWTSAPLFAQVKSTVAERNAQNGYYNTNSGISGLGNASVNDIAMTVLPNAPVDSATELPVPTVASASNGGVSVIKDDGTVVDITGFSPVTTVHIDEDNVIGTSNSGTPSHDFIFKTHIPSQDEAFTAGITAGSYNYYMNSNTGSTPLLRDINMSDSSYDSGDDVVYRGGDAGFDVIKAGQAVSSTVSNPAIAYISSDYNTGWMHGDIKGAFLSDTDTTNLVATDLDIVTNGNFAADSDWTKGTGWTISGGTATHTGSGGDFNQQIAVVLGKRYLMTVTVDLTGDTSILNTTLGFRTLANDGYYVFKSSWTANAVNSVGLYWTSTVTGNILVRCFSSDDVSLDNWVVQDVTDGNSDRSVNNNGLKVFGTITKSAVATGAELVAYSGYSASNYLVQPSITAPGTGDFSVTSWIKPDTLNVGTGNYVHLFSLGTDTTGGQGRSTGFAVKSSTHTGGNANGYSPYIYSGDGGTDQGTYNVSNFMPLGKWSQLVAMRRGGVAYLYLNGNLLQTGSSWTTNLTDTYLTVFSGIGFNEYGGDAKFALLRYSKSAPSPEQIKKMYEDEKVLFQENAKATLYGSSNAVTALAYDDTTELLHVGTSAGRSEFQGLRRINNTTTAVTTAISASNGLVTEQ